MKADRLPKIVLVGQLSRDEWKAGRPPNGVGGYRKEEIRGNENFLGGCKEGDFKLIGMEEECV